MNITVGFNHKGLPGTEEGMSSRPRHTTNLPHTGVGKSFVIQKRGHSAASVGLHTLMVGGSEKYIFGSHLA